MTTARYRQHICDKLDVSAAIRVELRDCYDKASIRRVLRRHRILTPKCEAIMRPVSFGRYKIKKTLTRCGRGVKNWWDAQTGKLVCRQCAAKLNADGSGRCRIVPVRKQA